MDETEQMARDWCRRDGHDPDEMVLPEKFSIPVVQTPAGYRQCIKFAASCTAPLWHAYAQAIRDFQEAGFMISPAPKVTV